MYFTEWPVNFQIYCIMVNKIKTILEPLIKTEFNGKREKEREQKVFIQVKLQVFKINNYNTAWIKHFISEYMKTVSISAINKHTGYLLYTLFAKYLANFKDTPQKITIL